MNHQPNYSSRLETFTQWQGLKSAETLAESGFVFLGGKDIVQCFTCGIILDEWKETDDVNIKHAENSPTCEFVKEQLLQKHNHYSTNMWYSVMNTLTTVVSEVDSINRYLHQIHFQQSSNPYHFGGLSFSGDILDTKSDDVLFDLTTPELDNKSTQ